MDVFAMMIAPLCLIFRILPAATSIGKAQLYCSSSFPNQIQCAEME
jgi:hypothetical protein